MKSLVPPPVNWNSPNAPTPPNTTSDASRLARRKQPMVSHERRPQTRSIMRFAAPTAVLAVAVLWNASVVSAKPEYTRRTKQGCEVCHPPDSRTLNEAGVYYRDHRSLDGYKPREQGKKAGSSEPASNPPASSQPKRK